jgi:hypothetical protein
MRDSPAILEIAYETSMNGLLPDKEVRRIFYSILRQLEDKLNGKNCPNKNGNPKMKVGNNPSLLTN